MSGGGGGWIGPWEEALSGETELGTFLQTQVMLLQHATPVGGGHSDPCLLHDNRVKDVGV